MPAATRDPVVTMSDSSHEYDVRTPPPWSTVTESRPATDPANVTRPGAAAATGTPGSEAKSMPQCPA